MPLTLSRKIGERVRIGRDIIIEIGETQFGSVRLHVDAPRELAITRADAAPGSDGPSHRRRPPRQRKPRPPAPIIEIRRSTKFDDD